MKKLLSAVLVLILSLSFASCTGNIPEQYLITNEEAKLIVHFIDVGQGDSTLLESAGEFVLIDAGESDYGDKVVKYINSRGAASLKYVIATHPHSDHVGGLKKVINKVDTENFITSETDQDTRTWMNVLDAVEENDVNYIDAVVGDTFSFGEAQFTILAPLSDDYSGYNNYSVVTKVTCGDISFLLTGDAEKESEQEMLYSGADLSADVLKCGHHGSSSSTTAGFLRAVNPAFAVISCGKDNAYGHPHTETISKLSAVSCTYFRTDEMGTIVVYTDGTGLYFSSEDGDIESKTYTAGERENTSFDTTYIGNKNSRVFHYPTCSGVSTMSEKNMVELSSREEAIAQGYTPCSVCDP